MNIQPSLALQLYGIRRSKDYKVSRSVKLGSHDSELEKISRLLRSFDLLSASSRMGEFSKKRRYYQKNGR